MDPTKILTVSSKRAHDKCHRQWSYGYGLGWAPVGDPSAPLQRGTDFHSGAESSHSEDGDPDKIDTAKKLAYDRWVKKYDDLKAVVTERALLVPLQDLYNYIGGIAPARAYGWYYGGVLDALVSHKDGPQSIPQYILDHKTVERFYPVPRLFLTEQLAMYCVAWEIMSGTVPAGGIISRVKQTEGHSEYMLNYSLKAMSMSKTDMKELLKQVPKVQHNKKRNVTMLYNTSNSNTSTSNKELRVPQKSGVVKISLKDSSVKLGVSEYDSEHRLIQSIRNMRGQLVHVQRHYFLLTREEKVNIVRDFLQYTRQVIDSAGDLGVAQNTQRSPGLHCNQCAFAIPCGESRLQEFDSIYRPLGDKFVHKAPNQEVMSKLEEFQHENSQQ